MKLVFKTVRWEVVNLFEVRKNNCVHSSTKLNKTKEKTASNKGSSQNGFSLEYQRSILNSIKEI